MKRIKVLQIAQATGGVRKHVLYLAERLNKERFEVMGAFKGNIIFCKHINFIFQDIQFDKKRKVRYRAYT